MKKKKDCNIEMIKDIGSAAIEIAIEDYKNGDLAKDVFEQIGRVLFAMQTTNKKRKIKKTGKKKQ
jgi:hypothetical protein